MTRQEPHTCDVCGDIFYVPQDPLRTLEINRGLEGHYQEDIELIYDLCFDCHNKLMQWILKVREECQKKTHE